MQININLKIGKEGNPNPIQNAKIKRGLNFQKV